MERFSISAGAGFLPLTESSIMLVSEMIAVSAQKLSKDSNPSP